MRKVQLMNGNGIRLSVILWSTITIVALACGCCSSGVSYNEADKTLIVLKNDAILSWKNTVIGSEKDVDTILLKKGKDGLVRLTYFNILKDSLLTVSGEDFHFNLKGGVFSIYAKGGVSVLTNKYENFTLDTLSFHDNCKRIVVEGFLTGRITYAGQRNDTNIHIIWLDIKSNDGRMVHVPVEICGSLQKVQVGLKVELRKNCDYIIQENWYEFGVF